MKKTIALKSLNEKAKNCAEAAFARVLKAPWPEAKKMFEEVYISGAVDALASQWHEATNPPNHSNPVFVECDVTIPELRHTVAYYKRGCWCLMDDYYCDVSVQKWMEIPQSTPMRKRDK